MNVGGFIKQALPWIGAAASGNIPALIQLAAGTVSKVVGKDVKANVDDISAAIAGATPEQLLALKQADNEMAVKLQELGFAHIEDLEKIAADDRANARAREMTLKDRIPAILALFITAGFFSLLALFVFRPLPTASEKVLDIMVGSLGMAWAGVVSYYFGSSAAHDQLTGTVQMKQS